MTVEFIGMIATRDVSETRTPSRPPVDYGRRLIPLVRRELRHRSPVSLSA